VASAQGWLGSIAAGVLALGAGCVREAPRVEPDDACLPAERQGPAPESFLLLCKEPPPPLSFTWGVPASVTVPFGGRVEDTGDLWESRNDAGALTYTVDRVEVRCWDGATATWLAVPQWPASFTGEDVSCLPGHQLDSPFETAFEVPGDAPLPPGGGLDCVARYERVTTSWCRQAYSVPPSPAFPLVVEFVSVTGAPEDPAARFALDHVLAFTGALDGAAENGAAWQQVRLAARTFTLEGPRDVALAFGFSFGPASEGSTMKLDLRFKLDGTVVAEGRHSTEASAFEAVVPGVAAGRHVISVEARGVRVDGEAAPVRITGPGPEPGGEARLEAVFL
jgi:hypothetical protein